MIPKARSNDLLFEDVGSELVAYDTHNHKVHSLNPTAALVWKSCDGQKTMAQLAQTLAQELSIPINEDLVWATLAELDKADLLIKSSSIEQRMTRRQSFGWMAATLLPAVVTLVAPTLAQAAY